MGGTQTVKVDLKIAEMENNKYEVKTKMYIGDWYGVYSAPTSGKTPGGRLEGGMFIFEKGKKIRKE